MLILDINAIINYVILGQNSTNHKDDLGWIMVLNATFSNIPAISWRLVLMVKEAGGTRR
jgi:hypothetical protein